MGETLKNKVMELVIPGNKVHKVCGIGSRERHICQKNMGVPKLENTEVALQ